MADLDQATMWEINRVGWDAIAHLFYGAAALPNYGPFAQTEEVLGLLGNIANKAVIEIGCGSGHSLLYLARQGARELWGLDLSAKQIEFAQSLLDEHAIKVRLLNAPMEQNPGIPTNHFDLAISIYALGWTTDLKTTLAQVYAYLKPGGFYVFSWEHPVYSCIEYESGVYVLKVPYREETILIDSWKGVPIVTQRRKMSTYINATLAVGFQIERLEENEVNRALAKPKDYDPESWYSVPRAELIPATFILKLRKPIR